MPVNEHTLPETNSSPLKMDGIGRRSSFLLGQKAYFQGCLLLVAGSVYSDFPLQTRQLAMKHIINFLVWPSWSEDS